jgi:cytochrome d ubiquinol oxidase subunit II
MRIARPELRNSGSSIATRRFASPSVRLDRPWLAVFPAVGLSAVIVMVSGLRCRYDSWPFTGAVLIFLAAFATLAASFLPRLLRALAAPIPGDAPAHGALFTQA